MPVLQESLTLLIEFQAILQLAERFIDGLDCFHAMPAKIMRGVFQVSLGISKRGDCFPNFWVRFRHSSGRGAQVGEPLQEQRQQRVTWAMPRLYSRTSTAPEQESRGPKDSGFLFSLYAP